MMLDEVNLPPRIINENSTIADDEKIIKLLKTTIKDVNKNLEKFRFADAANIIYQFIWHELADVYLESIKGRTDKKVALDNFIAVFGESLKLLHPFMPFVTEAIWQENKFLRDNPLLINSKWPE